MTIESGEGFYIFNNSGTNEAVILYGGVVLAATNQMALAPALNLIGFPYSTAIAFDDTGLWNLMQSSEDQITDVSTNAQDKMLPGTGYWYNRTGDSVVWSEVRPYADLFPADNNPPRITGFSVTDGGNSIKLQLARSGIQNVDIFYKEMSETGGLDTATGWSIAESNIPATQVEWVDYGSNKRSPVNEVYGRYYLVGNTDVDSNGNGIPDAREIFCSAMSNSFHGIGRVVSSPATAVSSNIIVQVVAGTNGLSSPISVNVMHDGIIYVDQQNGSDALSGCAAVVAGSAGPKKTIGAGLNAAESGNTLVIKSGHYSENLNIAGRNVSVVIAGNVDISGHSADSSVSLPPAAPSPTNVVGVSTNSIHI